VFPARRRGRIIVDKPASIAHLRRLVKSSVSSIGLDAAQFSAHSLRAGGATDLFAAGVPFTTIQKMGRWVSAAAVLYYRSVEDVWTTVGAAFSGVAARHSAAAVTGPVVF
jgi:integrase